MIRVLWPGKTKNWELRRLIETYRQRIEKMITFELVETREARGLGDEATEMTKIKEAGYLKKLLKDDYVVCLSDRGKEMSSIEFAHWLQRKLATNSRPLTFIIGGYAGLADEIMARANELLSLSRMTFSHELCRLLLLEQIYRSLTQMKGWPYAK
ncbi:MAG: 23S rRNA (pseudouridine(1915)-N(3))-methyltransferase RlmH [Candidatus Aminicenantes bacterium]|nr:23S rRNA (pseudouridine(1915)-N(3))-methyltransferase RlmH [Candidatus Aminicenantes bacterium]